jgi:ABC-2 type transport system ATP-binding protein
MNGNFQGDEGARFAAVSETPSMSTPLSPTLWLKDVVTIRGSFVLDVPELRVRAGEVACVVGPNGGGKTTLLLTVLGLLPHRGQCMVSDKLFDGTQSAIKSQIGFIPDDPEILFEELTAQEQWGMTATVLARTAPTATVDALLYHANELATALSFAPPAQIAKNYSHGMRKKTQMVNALLGRPPVIVIDELRNGLDPIAIKQSEDLIRQEKARGAAILAATHDLWWAERFADYIYVIDKGSIVAQGTLQEILAKGEKSLEDAFFRIVQVEA